MIITTIHQFESIHTFQSNGIDGIIVGIEGLSIRSPILLNKKELINWKKMCQKEHIQLYVNAIKLFMEEEIPFLKDMLIYLKELDIDGIYFSDEGLLYEAMQLGMENKLIYQPETLITNHLDAQFYLQQGIQAVSLAHELSLEEIQGIAQVQPIEVLISGYFSILYSKRPLITNYFKAVDENRNGKDHRYDLIEQTRSDRMPILEDKEGTHIFSEAPIQSFSVIDDLKAAGIKRFRIDSIFQDDAWTIEQVNAYKNHKSLDTGSDHWYYQQTIKRKEDGHE